MRLIDERLKRDGGAVGGVAIRARWTGDERTFANAARDCIGELLAIAAALRVLRLSRIGQKTALHQDRGNACVAKNIKAAPPHATVWRRRDSIDVIMNGRSERETVPAIKIS